VFFFFSSRRRHTRSKRDWSSDVCSSDLQAKDTKNSVDDIYNMIAATDYTYTLAPQKVFKTAEFMNKIGTVKHKPSTWKDLFFPRSEERRVGKECRSRRATVE